MGFPQVVSPFLGGGSVEVALAKELGVPVLAYDIFEPLVAFWQALLDPKEKPRMLAFLRELEPDRATYAWVKERLGAHWRYTQWGEGHEEARIGDRALLGALFFFNHQLSYGPGFLGWPSSVYLRRDAYERFLQKLEAFEAPLLRVERADFREVLPRHKDEFLFLGPPYYIGPGSKTFRGIYPQRNFPVHHDGFPHETLWELLQEHRGGFLLTYNDCSFVRERYREYSMAFPRWHYSMGLGETRVGKYRRGRITGREHIKESHEVLILAPPRAIPKAVGG